ncbi:MAG: hypothetical protein SF051_13840 [Elusimicrobiota bacterium]|nr:hypothetical protein [Elusimicrobiota bacterium]
MAVTRNTPFDALIEHINQSGYHNHRKVNHSDIVSRGIFVDLLQTCSYIKQDFDSGVINQWLNVESPGGRERNIDLFVGEVDPMNSGPTLSKIRICCENKSVITAHRNATNRFDDLEAVAQTINGARAEAIVVATVLVGISEKYLNVADRIKPYRTPVQFKKLLKRFSTGDEALFTEFPPAVSANTANDFERTIKTFRKIQVRQPGRTHEDGCDALLIIPVRVDNVHKAEVARDNPFGIDVDADYQRMLQTVCAGYRARWHPMS